MAIARINFTSVPCADQDRAIAFYRDRLGFEVALDAPYLEDWRWVFLALPGHDMRLHLAKREDLRWQEGMPALTLVSTDVDADCEDWRAAGVEITHGPEDAPWAEAVRFAMIRDSEGNIVLIESVKGE